MALGILVNGEAQVKVGTGAASALETLGVTVDGVEWEANLEEDPVMVDTFGSKVEFDTQYMGEWALIKLALVFFDQAVLDKLLARKTGGTAGVWASAGRLMGQSGDFVRLLITSPVAALPYNFPKTRLLGATPVKLGTRRSIWNLTFKAIPYTGAAGDTSGIVLYNRVIT